MQQSFLCQLERSHSLLVGYRWEIFQEILKPVPSCKVSNQRLHRDTRPSEYRGSA